MTLEAIERRIRARDDVVIGTGAAESEIAAAERTLGVSFPMELREYLSRFGHLELGHFELYGIGRSLPRYLRLVEMTLSERTEAGCPLPHHLVAILNDGGGNLYCLDASPMNFGRVAFWDHSLGPTQELGYQAESLEAWLGDLLVSLNES